MVSLGAKVAKASLDLRLPVKSLIRGTIFNQFCGGETLDECRDIIRQLGDFNVGTILDYAVEGSQQEKEFDETSHEIVRTIDLAKRDRSLPFCVFKVTGLARFELLRKLSAGETLTAKETEEWGRARHRIRAICLNAAGKDVRIFIDAEESWIQKAIDDLAWEMMLAFNREKPIIYNTVQMYRADRLDYLKDLFRAADEQGVFVGLKVVRGAYMEKERARAAERNEPSPILPTKEATDAAYDAALAVCFAHLDRMAICAGTHNEASTRALVTLMENHSLRRNDRRIYFSQLLGMSDNLSYNLAAAGYNVAKYVPYGPVRVLVPYLTRRAEENTSISGQTGRELSLIEQELRRRNGS